MITLTPEQIEDVKTRLVDALVQHNKFDYVLERELCRIIGIERRTLKRWGVPFYPMPGGVFYRLSEAREVIESRRVK